jgi:hypothetical protein
VQLEVMCDTAFARLDPGAIALAGTLPADLLPIHAMSAQG